MQVWTSPTASTCECQEAFVPIYRDGEERGRRRGAAAHLHNCQYIARRNALIPSAMRLAEMVAPNGGAAWAAAYLRAMEHLAQEARQSGSL